MRQPTATTYALLGMLAVRSWTGYELTQQLRRSLRFIWPSSEGHLYREQKRLVELGWAKVTPDVARGRRRNRYTITSTGQAALKTWLATEPQGPRFEIEGVLRIFFGDQSSSDDLTSSLRATSSQAREMLDEMLGFVDEYLEEGGPLWMLENDIGGPSAERQQYRDRTMYPERLHVIARVIDITTRLLDTIDTFASDAADETSRWVSPIDSALTASTRRLLETIRDRNR